MESQFKALERAGGVDDELAAMKKARPGSLALTLARTLTLTRTQP